MKSPRFIVCILAVVHLLLAATVVLCRNYEINLFARWYAGSWHSKVFFMGARDSSYCMYALTSCQGTLIAIWAALGGKPTPWRAILILVGIVVAAQFSGLYRYEEFIIPIYKMLLLMTFLLVFRLIGLELELPPIELRHARPLQFSIWQLMVWTTVFTIAMSAFCSLPKYVVHSFLERFQRIQLLYTMIELGIHLALIWFIFGQGRMIFRIFAIALAIGIAKVINLYDFRGFIWEAAWTIASLLVIRWAGYQMTWHWRLRNYQEPLKSNAE
jgi:hypothetical protein